MVMSNRKGARVDVKSLVWVGLRRYRYKSGHFVLIVIFFSA